MTSGARALWLSLLALVALALLAFAVGKFPVTPGQVVDVFWAKLTGGAATVSASVDAVVWQVRLPRVLAAILVGAALSTAGATYQGLFRNPLVSPDILGVAAGAGFGAVVGIFLSLPVVGIQALAFLGGLAARDSSSMRSAMRCAATTRSSCWCLPASPSAPCLAPGISLIKVLADPYNQLPAITFWLLGSLTAVTIGDVAAVVPAILLGLVPLFLLRWRMNLMSLGDEEAKALGVDTAVMRVVFIAAATLDDRGGRVDRRHRRLDRPGHAPCRAASGRAEFRRAHAGRHAARRGFPARGRHRWRAPWRRSRCRSAS